MKNLHPRTKLATLLATAFLVLGPAALAVDPPPDGGYPNQNTAEGDDALFSNTTGFGNTAVGFNALLANTSGNANTATGVYSLYLNKTGSNNTATGYFALFSNTFGGSNTAVGVDSLSRNTTGNQNTAVGFNSLYANTTGSNNVAGGDNALFGNTTGHSNTATGVNSLSSNTTGSFNVALGYNSGKLLTTGDANIVISNPGIAGESNTIRIGKVGNQTATYIAGISGATVAEGVGVIVDTNGHLGTVVSSQRFKDNIQPMDRASEAILALKPVTFHYKKELDSTSIPQFGLVAEQVAKVNPDLVARDDQGKPYTVRYEAVNAMLLNEFLKEHRKVEEQAQINQRQEATIARLEVALKEQAAQIQKVSDQLRTQAPAPRVVAKN